MPQIAHFQVEKWKSSLPWEGGHPPPTPSPRSVATLPRAWSLRSLAKIMPPQMFWLITPLSLTVVYEKHFILSHWRKKKVFLHLFIWWMRSNILQGQRRTNVSRVGSWRQSLPEPRAPFSPSLEVSWVARTLNKLRTYMYSWGAFPWRVCVTQSVVVVIVEFILPGY